MNEDTLTEILLQSDINDYGRLAQTNNLIYTILNSLKFWIKKYEYLGIHKDIFLSHTVMGDLEDYIDDYNHIINNIKVANIILWILNVEAADKNYKNKFLKYNLADDINYPFSIESGEIITIKKNNNLYHIQSDKINELVDENKIRDLLIMILREGYTISDNNNNSYISAPYERRYGLKQAYEYINI